LQRFQSVTLAGKKARHWKLALPVALSGLNIFGVFS
jgi:hypothetical protein